MERLSAEIENIGMAMPVGSCGDLIKTWLVYYPHQLAHVVTIEPQNNNRQFTKVHPRAVTPETLVV